MPTGFLATGDVDGNVYLWNVANGHLMATLHGAAGGAIQSIAFSPDGSILAVGDENANTFIWDMNGLGAAN